MEHAFAGEIGEANIVSGLEQYPAAALGPQDAAGDVGEAGAVDPQADGATVERADDTAGVVERTSGEDERGAVAGLKDAGVGHVDVLQEERAALGVDDAGQAVVQLAECPRRR